MDLEPLFFRLHERLLASYSKACSHRARRIVEYGTLCLSVMMLSILVMLHTRFVADSGCANIFAEHDLRHTDIYHVQIQGVWTILRDTLVKDSQSSQDFAHAQKLESCSTHFNGLTGEDNNIHDIDKASKTRDNNSNANTNFFNQQNPSVVEWVMSPAYTYSKEKGLLELPIDIRAKYSISSVNLTLDSRDECLGNAFLQSVIENFVGYDTIILNALVQHTNGFGFVFSAQTSEYADLSQATSIYRPQGPGAFMVQKIGISVTSLFLFFTASTLVALCLRETQFRVFQFTFQLQYYTRHRLPCGRLIMSHIIKSLVFVLVLIGILFFFAEFLENQGLAFLLLTNCWVCELFTIISVRSEASVRFFPRFFFLYFMLFHIYYFSFPFGFTYLAFFTMTMFVQHLILYFVNCHEIPSLQTRTVTEHNPRFPFHHSQLMNPISESPNRNTERNDASESLLPIANHDSDAIIFANGAHSVDANALRPVFAGGS